MDKETTSSFRQLGSNSRNVRLDALRDIIERHDERLAALASENEKMETTINRIMNSLAALERGMIPLA